jgi:RHH-type proline utilization regulon transcriptional repressor/proline dehydrogenase/delta 1-pyrroline-5-carboxylate dehydrogenase
VALMCLAEALLRIPDKATRDALIRDKIAVATGRRIWAEPSLFVNAATWGLLLTGKLVATHSEAWLGSSLTRVDRQGRRAADPQGRGHGDAHDGRAVRHRRDHRRGAGARTRVREAAGFRYSYDMLGEAAMTEEDAKRYLRAYEEAIHAIGKASARARHL